MHSSADFSSCACVPLADDTACRLSTSARSKSPEVLLVPLTVSRNANEQVLVEPSINSVRVSIKIKQADEIEEILARKVRRRTGRLGRPGGAVKRHPAGTGVTGLPQRPLALSVPND